MVAANNLRTFNAADYGVRADGLTDDAPALRDAVNAAIGQGGGRVVLPVASVVLVGSTIVLATGIELVVPLSCTLRLKAGANVDVVAATGAANVKITGGGTIDGNRASNPGGTPRGINLDTCTDVLIDDVLVTSAGIHGVRVFGCTRVEIRGITATDNGTHGISLNNASRCVVAGCTAYDNARVAAIGTGDGVNLIGTSSDNVVTGLVAYDSLGVGGRQGYAIREAAGMTGDRNAFAAVAGQTNVLGIISTVGALSGLQAGAPTGTASGGLAGTYPAPTLNQDAVAAVNADTAITDAHGTVLVDCSGGTRVMTLPTAVGFDHRLTFVKTDTAVNPVALGTTGGQTVNGQGTGLAWLFAQFDALTLASDGANWVVVEDARRGGRSRSLAVDALLIDSDARGIALGDASAAARTITLPTVVGRRGLSFTVKKVDATTNTVTVAAAGAETIDGAATFVLRSQWQSVTVQTDGVSWYVV